MGNKRDISTKKYARRLARRVGWSNRDLEDLDISIKQIKKRVSRRRRCNQEVMPKRIRRKDVGDWGNRAKAYLAKYGIYKNRREIKRRFNQEIKDAVISELEDTICEVEHGN